MLQLAVSSSLGSTLIAIATAVIAGASVAAVAFSLRRVTGIKLGSLEISGETAVAAEETAKLRDAYEQTLAEAVSRIGSAESSRALQLSNTGDPEFQALARDVRRVLDESTRLRLAVDQRTEALLKEYHAQGLAQSRVAFLFSIIFASLGFLLIAATVVAAVALNTHTGANTVALISSAIVEAVSGLFFVQSNRARVLMTAFFDKLRQDRSLEEALKLSESVPDPLINSRLKTVLSLRLANAAASDEVVKTVMATTSGESSGVTVPGSDARTPASSPASSDRDEE
jgi:hypothetical protein